MATVSYQKEITNHLEFLGYELDDLKVEQGFTYIATSPKKSTMVVRIIKNPRGRDHGVFRGTR